MKTAFYLGSFNPFHNGHLKVIQTAFESFKMDKVVIVPTMQNPWKFNKVLDLYDRANVISLSINDLREDNKYNITIDFIERCLDFPYYSYKTLEALKEKYPGDLYLLCGEDTFNDIPNWYNGSKILKEWTILTVERPEGSISSSEIRRFVKECKDITPYVNKKVVRLINLYYSYPYEKQ